MSVDCEDSLVLLSQRDSRTSCIFQSADEKDDVGEESVLEMLSYSKFLDLETWLCMPSSLLLPPALDLSSSSETVSPSSSSGVSSCTEAVTLLSSAGPSLPAPPQTNKLNSVLTSTPTSASAGSAHNGVCVRKRRRLAASPGGLHWSAAGSVQRDFWSPDRPVRSSPVCGASSERAALRKTDSSSDTQVKLLRRLDRGRRKLRSIQSLSAPWRYDRNTSERILRLSQRNQSAGDDLIRSTLSLDRHLPSVMAQPVTSLQLSQNRKCPGGPASPNAAKRLYRNLSEKLRGSPASFEDSYFFSRTDRIRKTSTMQGSDCLLEAVEQQDLDTVQMLLYQFSAEELDLNTPNGQGLTPLDIAVMTNNTPIAKLLLKAGGKESPHFLCAENRESVLLLLSEDAERRAADLSAQAQRDGLTLQECHTDKQLKAWEWRARLYRRMRTGFQHARVPEAPSMVRLSVCSSSSLTVTFQEPQSLNSAVVTRYRVEWSCLKDFSLLAGEMIVDNLQSLKCTIGGLTTGRLYFVRVSAYNMKGWGRPVPSLPPSAAPSTWRDTDSSELSRRHIESMERLLQQVRATHTHYCCGDTSKLQNPSRKQSVSRSLKHLFNSSNKFVKTLKRGVYLAAVFYHKDSLLVTAEDQIPIVEVDDSYSSSLMQDFLWFTKLSCMWDDVRWLRQTTSVSSSSSSVLQSRHKMLSAAAQLQSLLGTADLGRIHYEPIKDRHGNVLLVTIRESDSACSGRWVPLTKVQSQRKSLSTPEEPHALDVLILTIQDILSYQRRSSFRLSPGLYLGFLKFSSSVDQIRVLVSQRNPNILCHSRIRDNANVSREEWDWIQMLSAAGEEAEPQAESHAPLLFYELQTAIKSLLKVINLPLHQARHFRLYSQEVVELGHGVSFLLLLPSADDVCSAPSASPQYTPITGFIQLPLQMFELVHFCSYKQRFISLYCRLSSVLDLDALITQQALREAISDEELMTAKQRHQLILDYIQQLDETRNELRWLTDALQFARYKKPHGGVPVSLLLNARSDSAQQKTDSTSSALDCPLSPPPGQTLSDWQLGSDEDASSEVFLPTDSDYDSSDALSPPDLLSPDMSACALGGSARALGGSAPDVLHVHELRYSTFQSADSTPEAPPPSLAPALSDTTKTLEGLSLSRNNQVSSLPNPPTKRRLLSRSHGGQYFSGPQRWLRCHSGESLSGSLSEGVYTKQGDPPSPPTYVSHASCVLESRRGRHREPRPHARCIFAEVPPGRSLQRQEAELAVTGGMCEGEEPAEGPTQEEDSDEQTNAQVSEILSSTL